MGSFPSANTHRSALLSALQQVNVATVFGQASDRLREGFITPHATPQRILVVTKIARLTSGSAITNGGGKQTGTGRQERNNAGALHGPSEQERRLSKARLSKRCCRSDPSSIFRGACRQSDAILDGLLYEAHSRISIPSTSCRSPASPLLRWINDKSCPTSDYHREQMHLRSARRPRA